LSISFLAVHPTNSNLVFAGTGSGLFRSEDAGGTWTNSSSGMGSAFVRAMLFDPVQPSTVYAGTASGVYKSLESGTTNWFALNKGLGSRSVNGLAVDSLNSALLYAATDGGIYVSTNSATNWRSSNRGLASRRTLAIAIDPVLTQILYAGTARGFHRSVDGGTNWTQLTNGIGRPRITSLLMEPALSSTLWAGTTSGLFKSLDSGDSWAASQTNLTSRNIAVLANDGTPSGPLFTATRGTNFSGGTNDAFLVKIVPNGSALAYAFTFGGSRNDEARDVAVDSSGNAYITGLTSSRNFPVVGASSPSQTNNAGRSDVFVAAFDPTGSSNLFSIYLGGRGHDFGNAIAVDGSGNVYVAGQTESSHFVITNAVQPIFGAGRRDAFVLKLEAPAPGPFPVLRVARSSGQWLLQWPVSSPGFVLESCTGSFRQWAPVLSAPIRQNGLNTVTLPASPNSCFFRLRSP
jgi:photosystem II stability/assembly factor-like uncharacterized protein